ncbi:MAG TPA: hypothetical protein VMR81_07240 [Patescibacteria group bacterium]|jgi:hypothetical protein|nr:hypothetical protein [Patescibacteria group bacterium]
MAETKPEKKGTNPLVFVGIGCLVLLVVLGIASSIIMRFFAKRIGTGLLQSAIESRTGVKTNLQDLQNGKMTLTDQKTGAKMDISSGQIPDTFPKDFPIYPGAKVTSSLSGAQQGKSNGFWVTLTTADSFDKVDAYYKSALTTSGWKETSTFSTSGTTTSGVTKGTMSGSLSITQASGNKETDIVVVLGTDTATETPSE